MNTILFASNAWVQALGWTLIHALWQGALLALIVAVVLKRMPSPRYRYYVNLTALAVMLLAGITTFLLAFETPAVIAPVETETTAAATTVAVQAAIEAPAAAADWWQTVSAWLNARQSLIVGGWLAGFALLALRLLGNLWYLNRLRRLARPVETACQMALDQLAEKIAFSRPVEVLTSVLVNTPMAMGWLKPVILLPVGLVNQLTPAEVQVVLAHELAHLRRRDWLVNLAQILTETIFYFHPAVWWLSGQARIEREKCCDLLVLEWLGEQRLTYARALLRVQEFAQEQKHLSAPRLALGALGVARRPLLLERVQAILMISTTNSQQQSMMKERMLMAALLAAALAWCGLRATPLPNHVSNAAAQILGLDEAVMAETDTLPPGKRGKQTLTYENDNEKVTLERQEGQITRLEVNGKEIPPADYDKYAAMLARIEREAPLPPPPPDAPGMIDGVEIYSIPSPPGMPSGIIAPAPPAPPGFPSGVSWPAPPAPPGVFGGKGYHIIQLDNNNGATTVASTSGKNWSVFINNQKGKVRLESKNGKYYANGEERTAAQLREQYNVVISEFESPVLGESIDQLGRLYIEYPGSASDLARLEELKAMQEAHLLRASDDLRRQEAVLAEQLSKDEAMREKTLAQQEAELTRHRAQLDEQFAKQQAELAELEREMAEKAFPVAFQQDLADLLRKNGEFKSGKEYHLEMSNKWLKVDGKKVSQSVFEDSLRLYRKHTGKDFMKKGTFSTYVNG